jgi:GNAT superfamily N-acetyltransferase
VNVWKRRLWGEDAPIALTIRIATTTERGRPEIIGGIVYERYPRSGCGLVTYMVVARQARGQGLGERLQREAVAALRAAGAPAVFGEINDPRLPGHEPAELAWKRLERNLRWGARVVDARYVQPALGDGLARDRGLLLIALDARDTSMPGAIVRDFIAELHAVTEGRAPDAELAVLLAAIPETVALVELAR